MVYKINGEDYTFLFTFKIGEITYIAYKNAAEDISASRLVMEGENANLVAITDEEEWAQVEKEIEKRL